MIKIKEQKGTVVPFWVLGEKNDYWRNCKKLVC